MGQFYIKCLPLTFWLYAFVQYASSEANSLDNLPIVSTNLGKIRGNYLETRFEQRFLAFRGVRYAKAPRFEVRVK